MMLSVIPLSTATFCWLESDLPDTNNYDRTWFVNTTAARFHLAFFVDSNNSTVIDV